MIDALELYNLIDTAFIEKDFRKDVKSSELIVKLSNTLDKLKPQADGNIHVVWIKARRPRFDEFYDFYSDDDPDEDSTDRDIDEETFAQYRTDYKKDFPFPFVWFRLGLIPTELKDGTVDFSVFLNDKLVMTVRRDQICGSIICEDVLKWALAESEKVVRAVQDGTYEQILQNIPYRYRVGEIKRSDLWEIIPEEKEGFFSHYKVREITKFFNNFKDDKISGIPISQMTTRIYYEAYLAFFNSLVGKKKTIFNLYCIDYFDEEIGYCNCKKPMLLGLTSISPNNPEAFERWFETRGQYVQWRMDLLNRTILSARVILRKDKNGYFFLVVGDTLNYNTNYSVITIANALFKEGYPVKVGHFDIISKQLKGDDYVSLPKDEYGYFNSISFPNGEIGNTFAKKVTWFFYDYSLRSETD